MEFPNRFPFIPFQHCLEMTVFCLELNESECGGSAARVPSPLPFPTLKFIPGWLRTIVWPGRSVGAQTEFPEEKGKEKLIWRNWEQEACHRQAGNIDSGMYVLDSKGWKGVPKFNASASVPSSLQCVKSSTKEFQYLRMIYLICFLILSFSYLNFISF